MTRAAVGTKRKRALESEECDGLLQVRRRGAAALRRMVLYCSSSSSRVRKRERRDMQSLTLARSLSALQAPAYAPLPSLPQAPAALAVPAGDVFASGEFADAWRTAGAPLKRPLIKRCGFIKLKRRVLERRVLEGGAAAAPLELQVQVQRVRYGCSVRRRTGGVRAA